MSAAEIAAADFAPGNDGYIRDAVEAGEVCFLPEALRGVWTKWFNDSDVVVYLRFEADATITIDEATNSSRTGTTALGAAANAPHMIIPAGQERHFRTRANWTHFKHQAKASPTGTIIFGLAQGDFGAEG